MKAKAASNPAVTPGLRRRAETVLREKKQGRGRARVSASDFAADTARLLHELQVHQLELEMQNQELQESRHRAEILMEQYTDLYDFAPIGFFSMDEGGRITKVNLTGAALLGVERSKLARSTLTRFVAPTSQPMFRSFLERVLAGDKNLACELPLVKEGGSRFWANLHGVSIVPVGDLPRGCRLAVSDVTLLKEAQEEKRHVEALSEANQELKEEIVRRKSVEAALNGSRQQQARLLRESRRMQEHLRHLSHRMLRTQEEERKRISRELHDQISQTLVGINLQLQTLIGEAEVSPDRLRVRIAQTQRLVAESVNTVREFARDLRPALLDDLGLIPTLHAYLKEFTQRTGVRVQFTTSAGVENLKISSRTVLYRIAQSALTNVAQHAQATRVGVTLSHLEHGLRMEIRDDGKSFDIERVLHAKRGRCLGLLGMRERAEMVGGTLEVASAPGSGTMIRVEIPNIA